MRRTLCVARALEESISPPPGVRYGASAKRTPPNFPTRALYTLRDHAPGRRDGAVRVGGHAVRAGEGNWDAAAHRADGCDASSSTTHHATTHAERSVID